jgi:hypothetical protein
MTTVPTPISGTETAGARVMSDAWTQYSIALWRGDPAASAFAEWLAGFWEPSLDRPARRADAQSRSLLAGGTIDWFEQDGWVSGHIPGQAGGYLLPRAVILHYSWILLEEPAA